MLSMGLCLMWERLRDSVAPSVEMLSFCCATATPTFGNAGQRKVVPPGYRHVQLWVCLFQPTRTAIMTDTATSGSLIAAVERYFEMMSDYDVGRFEEVFAPTAQLHGLRDGAPRASLPTDTEQLLRLAPPQNRRMPLGIRLFFSSILRLPPRLWSKFVSGSMRRCTWTICHFIASTTPG